jgi:hypothetical protein
MFALILKIVAGVALLGLLVIIFVKILPFLLIILAAVGLWKLYQWLSKPKGPPGPRPPLNWPY